MTLNRAIELLKMGCRMPSFCSYFHEIDEACEIACQALQEKIDRESQEHIPYRDLEKFIYRPVFIVYGGIKMWTILNSVGETSSHFSQSSDFGIYLAKDRCGISWFAYEFEPKI